MTCRRGLRQLYMAPDVPDRTECPTTSSGEKQGRESSAVAAMSGNTLSSGHVAKMRRRDVTHDIVAIEMLEGYTSGSP